MKSLFLFLVLAISISASAQNVGINTNSPEATLQVVGSPTTTTVADGIIPPTLTGNQLKDKDAVYLPAKAGAIVYVTAAASPTSTKTANVTAPGFYYFNGTAWQSLAAGSSIGDVKSGIQAADHNGWVKLDGRAISSLTASQQARATALGLSGNLPNAANTALIQNATTLGSISGSMTKTIAQNQLPNVTFNGTTSSIGDHSHPTRHVPTSTGGYPSVNVASFKHINSFTNENDIATTDRVDNGVYRQTGLLEGAGAHNHTFTTSSLNGNTAQQTLDITPRSLSVNMFIYLGL